MKLFYSCPKWIKTRVNSPETPCFGKKPRLSWPRGKYSAGGTGVTHFTKIEAHSGAAALVQAEANSGNPEVVDNLCGRQAVRARLSLSLRQFYASPPRPKHHRDSAEEDVTSRPSRPRQFCARPAPRGYRAGRWLG